MDDANAIRLPMEFSESKAISVYVNIRKNLSKVYGEMEAFNGVSDKLEYDNAPEDFLKALNDAVVSTIAGIETIGEKYKTVSEIFGGAETIEDAKSKVIEVGKNLESDSDRKKYVDGMVVAVRSLWEETAVGGFGNYKGHLQNLLRIIENDIKGYYE